MTELMTLVPPVTLFVLLAVAVALVPRRVGHGMATLGGFSVAGWLLVVPSGRWVGTQLFGFDAVLFNVDPFSRLLGIAFGVIGAFGVGYLYTTGADRRQTAYALLYLGAGSGAVFAGDWLTLVVFWELMAVAATVLIWHRTADHRCGLRYAIYHELGGLVLIGGVLVHFQTVGTFLYGDGITSGLAGLLVGIGIGLNCGVVGLHVWLVDAYPRTHVATSVVLAAVTTKVGAVTIVRAFPDGHLVLAHVGGAMVLFGVTFAILQSDIRRLLSYHIISQVGYMVAGFGAGTALASAGAMGHVVNNILFKSLLFMIAGVVIQRTGRESLKSVGGLARELPVTMGMFIIAALSIAGLPGLNGFITKGMVIDGVDKAGYDLLWYVLIIGGVGTVISFAKLGDSLFLRGSTSGRVADLSRLEIGILGGIAGICILIGLFPGVLFSLLPSEGVAGANPFAQKQFEKSGAVTLVGVVTFIVIRDRLKRMPAIPDLELLYNPLGRWLRWLAVGTAISIERGIHRIGGYLNGGLSSLLAGKRRGESWPTLIQERPTGEYAMIGEGVLALVLTAILLLGFLLS